MPMTSSEVHGHKLSTINNAISRLKSPTMNESQHALLYSSRPDCSETLTNFKKREEKKTCRIEDTENPGLQNHGLEAPLAVTKRGLDGLSGIPERRDPAVAEQPFAATISNASRCSQLGWLPCTASSYGRAGLELFVGVQ